MFQQTRPLYVKPFLGAAPGPPPPELTWPRKVYAATIAMGVYYTENFDNPDGQPTWVRVNDGLGELKCKEFHLDPFDNENRQFVLTQERSYAKLYRREYQGAWEVISDRVSRAALCGEDNTWVCGGFCIDPSSEGRVWLTATSTTDKEFAFVSNDYGSSWNYCEIDSGPYAGTTTIRALGNTAWTTDGVGFGAHGYILWTEDGNKTWTSQCVDLLGRPVIAKHLVAPNYSIPNYVTYGTPEFGNNLGYFESAANYGLYVADHTLSLQDPGKIWYSRDDLNHQRMIYAGDFYITYDNWSSYTIHDMLAPHALARCIAPWAGDNENNIIIEKYYEGHIVGIMTSENDLTTVGRSGNNVWVAPFVDSIPQPQYSGRLCTCGVQAVREDGYVYI